MTLWRLEQKSFLWDRIIKAPDVPAAVCGSLSRSRSTLAGTRFRETNSDGLFAAAEIQKGSTICSLDDPAAHLVNDAVVDYGPILDAKTDEQMYVSLCALMRGYCDRHQKVMDTINVELVIDQEEQIHLRARSRIAIGEELVRAYGATWWFGEVLPDLTLGNSGGFIAALMEFLPHSESIPYNGTMFRLHETVLARCRQLKEKHGLLPPGGSPDRAGIPMRFKERCRMHSEGLADEPLFPGLNLYPDNHKFPEMRV